MWSGYSTLYLRKTFVVDDPAKLGTLKLDARYDDAFLLWINGTLIARDNISEENPPYDGVADRPKEVRELTRVAEWDAAGLLTRGTNVVAVQVLNMSLSSSTDCFFDLRLTADPAALAPQEVVYGRPWHYEIQALWESEPDPIFEQETRIPAGVVEPNQTYRVRCAFQDSSGRWSHWSEPVQFGASPATVVEVAPDLKISEIMYNPAGPPAGDARDNDEFEFLELYNSGSEPLDLSSVSFTDGIRFEFKTGQIQALGPGEFVLIVKNIAAFESRYGADLMPRVAGAYGGRLSNGGETIRMVDFWTGTLDEFAYDDDWHDLTDGGGFSLTLVDVNNDDPDSLGAGQAWRPSRFDGGSPGYVD